MANKHRGEIDAVIGGQPMTLCLTLGALAELEDRLQANDLAELGEKFAKGQVSAKHLLAIIGAGVRGGGNKISDDELAKMPIENGIIGAAQIAGNLLRITFGASSE